MLDDAFINNNDLSSKEPSPTPAGGCGCFSLLFFGILIGVITGATTFGLGYSANTAFLVGGITAVIPIGLYFSWILFFGMIVVGLMGLVAAAAVMIGLNKS